ncbi:MAG: translation initiation factor IF-3 [Patescibacteria group bacterium]|nr:translation initiation factor IF-3 [Patescibacteria group bacterium]
MRISRRRFRPKTPAVVYIINEQIRFPQLRVITDEGEHLGIMSTGEALQKAREREQDLVVIQTNTDPPIAKIIDFGKYKFERNKEIQKQKAKAKTVEVKGVRLSVRIGEHDLETRRGQAKKFLDNGDKVKVEIILRGREKRHGDRATQIIQQFITTLNAEMPVKVEQPVVRQGGQLTSIVGKA